MKRIKVRSPFKSKLVEIDRIWAACGVVCMQRRDNGRIKYMRVGKMGPALESLKQEFIYVCKNQPHLKNHFRELLDKVLEAVRQARYQVETGDRMAVSLQNTLKGLDSDGKPVQFSFEENLGDLVKRYPLMEEAVIEAILASSKTFDEAEKEVARVNLENFKESDYQL